MKNRHPLVFRCAVFVVLPGLIAVFLGGRYLYSSLPQTSGQISVQGLAADVEVVRDQYGVPYITGSNDLDVYFAIGFVHAQDRLWQLELQRRISKGTLSEVFGRSTIDQDIWFRTLDLHGTASRNLPALSEHARKTLAAYSEGINAWLKLERQLPIEFRIFGIQPEPWSPADSLSWIKIFALNLSGNIDSEIEQYVAGKIVSPQQIKFLYPGYPKDGPSTVSDSGFEAPLIELSKLMGDIEKSIGLGGEFVGSNAWVVSGAHTTSGSPILANDPHLALQMPSLWYALSAKGQRLNLAGMSLVGLPLVVFGHNGSIAWGGTNMMADTQDLYFEQLNPENPEEYKVGDRWQPFSRRTVQINVRQDFPSFLRQPFEPVNISIRSSRNGPIITDIVNSFEQPVALKWTALNAADTSYEAFLGLHYASNWSEFQDALGKQVAPVLNMVYADRDNNIGYKAAGEIPIRRRGKGTKPSPGWDDDYSWSGSIPPSELPVAFNPPEGLIVSANNRVIGDEYPYFISEGWAHPSRARRISSMLAGEIEKGTLVDQEFMRSIQMDTFSELSLSLIDDLIRIEPDGEREREALDRLSSWGGFMDSESVAATIFHVWMRHLRDEMFNDELKLLWSDQRNSSYIDSLKSRVSLDVLESVLSGSNGQWCDDVKTAESESCDAALHKSLQETLDELEKLYGRDMNDWAWGGIQKTSLASRGFQAVTFLEDIFSRKIDSGGGSPDVVNLAVSTFDESDGYEKYFGAGFRQIIELKEHEVSHLFMNSTGQSGLFVSPHYDDMVIPFRDVGFHEILEEEPVNSGDKSTLVLTSRLEIQQ